MRRIVMFNRVSADGFFADASGGLGWVVPEPELDRAAVEGLDGSDAILFGRKTYQMFESFWPRVVAAGPTAPDPHGNQPTREARAIGAWINRVKKYVFSRTLAGVAWENAQLLGAFDPRAVEAIKNEPGKGIMIFGSGSIVSLLAQHDLIDEYQLVVCPTLLGSGRLLTSGLREIKRLSLTEAKAFPSGNVRLRYVRAG